MIELTFLKILMLIKQVHQKNVLFANIGIGCHDVLITSENLSENAILNILGVDYHCIINRISKSEAVDLLRIANLNEKSGTL